MATNRKEQKHSGELVIGDKFNVGGVSCVVTKVEDIFHYVPNSRVRLSLSVVGSKTKSPEFVLFLPHGIQIELLK